MKLMIYLLTLILFVSVFGFSAGSTDTGAIERLLPSGKFLKKENRIELYNLTKDISFQTKLDLYDRYQMNPWWGFGLNLVPSLGSWLQGDCTGAITTDIGLTGSIIGFISTMSYLNSIGMGSSMTSDEYEAYRKKADIPLLLSYAFFAMIWSCEIANLIYPFTYASYYNGQLEKAINGQVDSHTDRSPLLLADAAPVSPDLFHLELISVRF